MGGVQFLSRYPRPYAVGGSPEKEGTEDDNRETVFEDKDGPSSCSPNGQGLPSYAVNTSTRGLVIGDVLFATKGLGPEMRLELTYSPVPWRSGSFGNGWAFSLDESVSQACDSAILTKGSHQSRFYIGSLCPAASPDYPIALTPTKGTYDRLERTAAGFAYTPQGSRDTRRFESTSDNAKWRLSAITDKNGNTLSIARNPDGTIDWVTDAAGRTASFTYASGRCVRIDAPGGTHASFVYDASGNLVRVTDLAGVVTEYGYNGENYLTSMTVGGKITRFAYDATDKGALASLTDAEGNVVTYARDAGSGAITRTDAKGQMSVYQNADGATTRMTDPLGRDTQVVLDAVTGQRQSVTDQAGVVTEYQYDGRGNTTRIARSKDGLSQVWSMTYDAEDNLLTRTNPLGKTWTSVYAADGSGNLLSTTTPAGLETGYAYYDNGLLKSMTRPGNRKWDFEYDAQGNLIKETNPLAQVTTFEYDAVGNRTLSRDPRGNVTRLEYDANRRRTRLVWPTGASNVTEYGCCAPETQTDERGGVTAYTYDGLLRQTSQTNQNGGITTSIHDANGNLIQSIDPVNKSKTMTYDQMDRLTGSTDPLNESMSVSYNAFGKPLVYTDENGHATTLRYDALGGYTGMTDALGKTVALTLDAAGRVVRRTNARGGTVDFTLDDDGRLVAKQHGATEVAAFTYHGESGDLASVASASYGTVAYTRDALGRVTRIDYPDGKSAGFTYDAAGNMDTVTYPGNLTATLAYNSRDLVSALALGSLSMSLGYDAAGNLTSESRSNGVSSAYGYDAAQLLTSVSHVASATPLAQLGYTRDPAGRVIAETGFQPLAPWQAAGSRAGAFDTANRQQSFGPEGMTTDHDGNVTAIAGARSMILAYDPENRPTSVSSGGVVTTYVYDGQGNRVRRTRGGVERNYHYDHLGRLLFETDQSGAVTMLHVHVGQRLVASGTQTGGFHFYHMDKTGNTLALTDAVGTVVAAYAYDPYGRVLSRTGTADTEFTFVGVFGVMDEGDGIFFMRNRYYDAVTGRFLQKDPIGFDGGFNLYRYVENNPITRIDPSGLREEEEWLLDIRQKSELNLDPRTLVGLIPGVKGYFAWKDNKSAADVVRETTVSLIPVYTPAGIIVKTFNAYYNKMVECGQAGRKYEGNYRTYGDDVLDYLKSFFGD